DLQTIVINIEDTGRLADYIATNLPNLSIVSKQFVLEQVPVRKRLEFLNTELAKELEVLELRSKIQNQVQEEVGKSQREYFLREQFSTAITMTSIKSKNASSNTWLFLNCGPKVKRPSSGSSGRRAWERPRLGDRSLIRWGAISFAFRSEACGTRQKSADTGGRISGRCRGRSSRTFVE